MSTLKDKKRDPKILERDIKLQVKDYLAIKGIFSYPLVQGIASYPGLPDRVMHYRGAVIYLEVKRPGGVLSDNQKAFQAQCKADGIPYWVIDNVEELIRQLDAASDKREASNSNL